MTSILHPVFGTSKKIFSGYDIPPQEVAELYKLYTQTGGPSWIDHTNWFKNKQCATWYGLTVAGGRVTAIDLKNNNLAGVTSFNPKPFAALQILYAQKDTSNTTLSMRFALADLPAGMQNLYLYNTQSLITGSLADLPAGMLYLNLNSTQSLITGSLADLPATMLWLYLYSTQSLITGGASAMAAKGIQRIRIYSTAATLASQNSVVQRLYADRALFTYATPELQMGGTNPDPSGVYQTSAAPATELEMLYALVNDPNAEGFSKWTATY